MITRLQTHDLLVEEDQCLNVSGMADSYLIHLLKSKRKLMVLSTFETHNTHKNYPYQALKCSEISCRPLGRPQVI